MSDTRIVTIANHWPQQDYYCYNSLFKSVVGNEILILGTEQGQYTGLSDKPRILYNAIMDGRLGRKVGEIIVFIDAYDVVFVDSIETIIAKFKTFDTEILIGAERNCFPNNFRKEYDRLPHTSSFKYLNSGVIIGYTDAILEALEAMDAPNLPRDYHDPVKGYNHHFNDQAYYMDLFLRQPVKMKLDYDCIIAQNMQDVTMDEIALSFRMDKNSNPIGTEIRNLETKSFPSIIHWNGGSKSAGTMQPILKHLNLI